ncbi:hypothetical protein ABZS71_04765 [Streptomyces sp. NPDC005393]|uniref:hypothetical protein n=1 Tax=Streptomyces sp. NPDC005393 TaxID=3157041 RepID=UPI0033B9322A
MKNGRVALVFTSGYLFGRGHKRTALMLAGLAAGKQLGSCRAPGGVGRLKSSELGKLGNKVGRQLVSAGRSAAMSAASHRIDALSDRMERRASMLRSGSEGREREEPAAEDEEREESEEDEEREEEAASRRSGGDERRGGERRGGERRGGERRGSKPPQKPADRPAKGQKKTTAGGSERRAKGDE